MLKVKNAPLEADFVRVPISYSFERVDSEVNGKRFSRLEKRESKFQYSNFRSRDFQIRELLESGATDYLKPTGTISGTKLDALDAASIGSNSLDSAVAAAEIKAAQEAQNKVVDTPSE